MGYFLLSVSTRKNLEECKKYSLAGFTNSINGVWTFSDIQEGDYVSFLYGAKAHNLYQVDYKEAIRDSRDFPPWEPITFKVSGITYYFPFRLRLKPVRELCESLVRTEFAYVAENLLLRGGYHKTHFQADQTTLQNVSQLGSLYHDKLVSLETVKYETFSPRFIKTAASPPEVFRFSEVILQAVIRQYLSDHNNLTKFLNCIGIVLPDTTNLDVLGEKALPEGHIDILIKEAVPIGVSRKIIIEIKTGPAKLQDIKQIRNYLDELGDECLAGILIAKAFSKKIIDEANNNNIDMFSYYFGIIGEIVEPVTFEELRSNLSLTNIT